MPTLSEILAKRDELQKTNPQATNLDARNALMASPTLTPAPQVTPQTPPPQAPMPPPPQPQANAGDVVVGVDGKRFIQANNADLSTTPTAQSQVVNQSGAPLTQMQEIQAASTGKRAGLNTEVPKVDWNVGLGNEDRITTNLEKFKSQNMNPDQIKQASGYDTADTNKKAIIDGFIGGMNPVVDTNSVLNMLKTGVDIPPAVKNTPYYKSADIAYKKIQNISTMSPSELTTAMTSGMLIPGTMVYNELLKDPVMKQKITEARAFTGGQQVDYQKFTQAMTSEILSANPNISNALADGTLSEAEYSALTNTPEVVSKATDVENKINAYNKLKAEYDDIETQVNKDFPGSPFADSIIADRKKAKYKDLILAQGEADTAKGTLAELKAHSTAMFDANLQLWKDEKARIEAQKARNQEFQQSVALKQMDNAYQDARDTKNFGQNVALKQMDYANQDVRDSKLFKQDIAKIGMQQDYQSSRDDVGFQRDLQKLALQFGYQDSKDSKDFTQKLVENGMDINGATFTANLLEKGGVQGVLSTIRDTGQCGEGANDYAQKLGLGRPFGDTYASKKDNINSDVPAVGGFAIFNPGGKFADSGHVGMVTAISGDKVTITDLNWKGDEQKMTHTVSLADIKAGDGGFYNPMGGGEDTTQKLSDKQFTQYNQTKTSFKSEPIVKSFEEALISGGDIIQSLNSENGPGDVGAVFNFMKTLDPSSTVREGEFALAAKSAGVWESFKNIPANKLEGTILTDKQRKDFGKLAMKYIESKGKLYDTKYDDMTKVLKQQGVPESYYPTRMTDYVNQYKKSAPSNESTGFTGNSRTNYSLASF